ncbi:MAG: xanthine dehydrogenase family protein subunit M [Desulfarculaceae bacterium]|nr:xanthine dehydrogenase family protein subunit M [Desulfarculaceae bacterium]MCF8047479.1 xanthine dehydrogenase family protein subunit M [Desulfarculaceae bacterium]MCF8063970.1 xanthine dehydrogenase family protein subunit M [Desulfarculaceae bacterium]MCF8097009.1 xanthine dehydrogenase family protein subunit M [Desulfarculaceae bacterium]MCF8122061.1 xanthine dehydrogenase family protein subunit M [Desulfarculaceae bacterium]
MAEGEFFRAASPQEAAGLLAQHGGSARVLAGGTDLMVAVNKRMFKPQVIIYLGDAGMSGISQEGDALLIGAATPLSVIQASPLVADKTPLLAAAIKQMASPAIRNAGTIGGNLANASPAADTATPLLALGASLKLVGAKGEREVPLAEFFTGPGQSVLGADEIIAQVKVPAQPAEAKWAYRKVGKRKAQSLSVVSVAVYCSISGGQVSGAAIALGAVAPTPLLAQDAAGLLQGKTLDEATIAAAAKAAAEATSPIDDARGTAWYRKRASEAVVKQLLTELAG